MALDARQITHTALQLLNVVGLDGLTTRRLAAELHVKSPALYKHFTNRAELLDHMATSLLTSALHGLEHTVTWQDWLRNVAAAIRAMLSDYRDSARLLVTSSPSTPSRIRIGAEVSRPLVAQGFGYRDARHAVVMLSALVGGWMLNEEIEPTGELMHSELGDVDQAFNEAIEVVIAGIESRRANQLDAQQ